MAIDINDVTKVVYLNCQSDVNAYISLGWVVLNSASGVTEEKFPDIVFALGWPNTGGEPKIPPDRSNWL